jgi:tetratricopeptide (TPR) repeat protein
LILRYCFSFFAILVMGLNLSGCSSEEQTYNTPSTSPTEQENLQNLSSLEQREEYWRETLAQNPDDPNANYRLGLVLAIADPAEALTFFGTASQLTSEYNQKITRVTDAHRIGELSENPAYRLTLLGQAYGAIDEWELALLALEQATQQDPSYAEAWAYLGEAQQQNGEDGFSSLEEALSINPSSYAANLLMALYYRRNDSPEEALSLLLVAAEQDPNNLTLKEDIAHVYAETGQVEKGLEMLEAEAGSSPDQSLVWQMVARFCLTFDIQIREAGLTAARQAVLLDDQDPIGLVLLARSYLQTGNTSMAERLLWQAIELDPASAETHYYLGVVFINDGNDSAAQEQLNVSFQLAPNSGIGQQALQLLEQYFGEAD